MNPAQLLAHFDRISEAPDAISRLRRFILDLAVRGKLVEQDPNEEPAFELLKRIRAEKARLVRAGAIKKQESLLLSEDEEPFQIPVNWTWTRLGEVGDWGSGSTPPRGNLEFYGGGITWLKSGELNDNRQLKGSEETVAESALSKCSFRRNQPGDVLIAMYGATIGKVAILAEPAVTNQAVCGCTPFSGVFNLYLFNFLLSQRAQFHSASEGGAQPNISKVKIVGFTFPLPPLAEQHRIVAKVDELISVCDRLEAGQTERERRRDRLVAASLDRLNNGVDAQPFREHARFHLSHLPRLTTRPAHIQQHRQTILNLAVRGQLVPQDPKDEPASELLKRFQAEKKCLTPRNRGVKKERTFQVDGEGYPFDLPESWAWSCLGDVSQYGLPDKVGSNMEIAPDTWVLDLEDIEKDTSRLIERVKSSSRPFQSSKTKFRKGDVLFGKLRPYLNKVLVADADGACTTEIVPVRGYTGTAPEYIRLVLKSPLTMKRVDRLMYGMKMPRLGTDDAGALVFPLPPLAEQHRIVTKVEELLVLCDRLEAQLATTQTESRRFLEAFLHQALSPMDAG